MKPTDRARLTAALREHVAAIAGDLRAQMRAPGSARGLAVQLHKDEAVGDDFDVWTDLLSRRAAVLWVLKSVYVRVLEDRGLLAPGRLLDPEAQQLFEKLAPNLGDTAFLRWVYKDLASPNGGLPELFSVQPAELVLPSDERSRALIAFWRHRDADSGNSWSFKEERFEGELMGDLYQELDPVVKDRFALCQTPDFVREFILDRTLTPAIETFGADKVRLLDPACGSGHFLIDGLKRLVVATGAMHGDWSRAKVLESALGRVVGMDLNDYACALARARLVMTAAELAGVNTLAEAARFHPHVYWADGLEQVERDEVKPSLQFGLFEAVEEKPRATLTRADVRAALRKVFAEKFHAVVANPPYITEKDSARKDYHREKVGKAPRYNSVHREYSLGSPFTERCFQLAEKDGFIGIITGNNFMKREFGKPLIEKVLSSINLTLVVDTSHAHIPFHGTSTVLLFARNQRPGGNDVRAVMGKRGEVETPPDPARGRVWSSIAEGWDQIGFENEFVSVAVLPRLTLARHPWSLGGGGTVELKEFIQNRQEYLLGQAVELIGFGAVTRADEVFELPIGAARRLGLPPPYFAVDGFGEVVRDWSISHQSDIAFPYTKSGTALPRELGRWIDVAWRYRTQLWSRQGKGFKTKKSSGGAYFEYSMFYPERHFCPFKIAFVEVSSHNHFVLDRGGTVFKQTAPIIKLAAGASEDDHLALLGLLNSSIADFWVKQMFQVKGGESTGKKRQSEAWSRRIARDASKLALFPIITKHRERVIVLARRLDALAQEFVSFGASMVLDRQWEPAALEGVLFDADTRRKQLRDEMVATQEELDWTVYVAFGLASKDELVPMTDITAMASEHRPFAIRMAQAAVAGLATNYWFEAMNVARTPEVPSSYSAPMQSRLKRRLSLLASQPTLALLESPEYKRKWEPITWSDDLDSACLLWLGYRLEDTLSTRGKPSLLAHIVSAVQDDAKFLAMARVYQDRRDIDISGLVAEFLTSESVPSHRFHTYTELGLAKRAAWEDVWALQRREDAGETIDQIPIPPEYSQGSRGKTTDFLRTEFWQLRGRLDVPKERFIAFTEVPGRSGAETLYGWAGWTPLQRLKALLAIDEELEDAGIPLADRTGVLDSAWRLLPDVAREDAPAAARLKAELQALVGPTGPSPESLEDWRKRFPPPRPPKKKTERARKAPRAEEDET